jgi:hypothetical protein
MDLKSRALRGFSLLRGTGMVKGERLECQRRRPCCA